MSDLADRHRLIGDVLEPLERMGVDAVVAERSTDDGDLRLTLELRVPPTLDPAAGGPEDSVEALEAQCERLREERDAARERLDEVVERAETLQERVAELEDRNEGSANGGGDDQDAGEGREATDDRVDLTDGERETLRALRTLGGSRASGEIADEVDATLQSVRSWLPKLVQAGHVRTEPDPTDGRRKLYSAVEEQGRTGSRDSSDARSGAEAGRDGGSGGDQSTDARSEADEPRDEESGDEQPTGARSDTEEPRDEESGDEQPTDVRSEAESPPDAETGDPDGTVYIASSGGSPSQVFHVRRDCPQLQRSTDCVEKDRSVVPHHRPCGTCSPDGLEEGLVAIAEGSPTSTYHRREDCPKLGSAVDVGVRERDEVPNYEPCDDCVDQPGRGGDGEADGGDEVDEDDGTAARVCARNDLQREAVVEALDAATALYHVQRDLTLSSEATEALLRDLGVFEDLDGGGNVTRARAKSVAREHVPPATRLESHGGDTSE